MVATVGSISIDLSTNTAKFTQGFKQSASTVERESKRMSNAVNGFAKASKAAGGVMSGFVGGIVAGGALASIGSLSAALGKARQSLSDFEEIGNRAKATGLSTDTFQAISHGASLADVEQESLNKSLEIFAKNAGLAKEGTGTLYSGLIKLNPQLLQSVLHATSQEERLKLVADAMAKMTDATDKAALATAVFGRGGAEMVRVLDKGSASIEEMKRQAKELGIIIPEDLIARAGELDDKLTTLAKVVDVQLSQALVKAAPLLVGAAEATAKFATELNAVTTAINAFVSNPSMDEFGKLMSSQFFKLTIGGKDVVDIVKDIAAASDESFASISADIKEAEADLAELKAAAEEGFDVKVDVDKAVGHLDLLRAKLTSVTNEARSAFAQAFREAENASMAGLSGGGGGLPRVHYRSDQGPAAIDEDAADKIQDAIDKETEATKGTTRAVEGTTRAVSGLGAALAPYERPNQAYASTSGSNRDILAGRYRAPLYNEIQANKSSFGSWAGKRMTFGGGGGNSGITSAFGRPYRMGSDTVTDASTITSGGGTSGNINVNVVVKPVLEGQRLSAQSAAEIKQAAAAGANAALRAYNGR